MIKLIVSDIDGTLVKDGTLDINPEYMDMTSEKYRIWQKTLRANRL